MMLGLLIFRVLEPEPEVLQATRRNGHEIAQR